MKDTGARYVLYNLPSGNWMIGSEGRRWDCRDRGLVLGTPSGGTSPADVGDAWQYSKHGTWLYGDNIRARAVSSGVYASLQMAVGKDWAPAFAMTGLFGTIGVLTVVALAVRRRRRHQLATEAEHVPLAESEEPTSSVEDEADGSSDEQEKLTLAV